MTWSLVIHDDPDLVQTITKMVADVLGGPVVGVTNFADARAQVCNNGSLNCQLVVSGVSPPSAANVPQPLEGNRPAATAFFREIRAGGDKPPFLFLLRFNQGFDNQDFDRGARRDPGTVRVRVRRQSCLHQNGGTQDVPTVHVRPRQRRAGSGFGRKHSEQA